MTVAWLADPLGPAGVAYSYAGHEFEPMPLPPMLAAAMAAASDVAGTVFNAV